MTPPARLQSQHSGTIALKKVGISFKVATPDDLSSYLKATTLSTSLGFLKCGRGNKCWSLTSAGPMTQ